MSFRPRVARLVLIAATAAGLAAGTGTAVANPSLEHRSAATGTTTQSQGYGGQADDNRPAGTGQGRKIG